MPSARYYPSAGAAARPPRRKNRRVVKVIGVMLGIPLLLAGLLVGYLFLAYNRTVGAPPNADPMPPECVISTTVLHRAGTPSWQSGPLRARGVTCRWTAAEEENIRQRMLTATVEDYGSIKSARAQVAKRAKELAGARKHQGLGDQAVVSSSDGTAIVIAREGGVIVQVEYHGSDKTFTSAVFGEDVALSAVLAEESARAVVQELLAKAKQAK